MRQSIRSSGTTAMLELAHMADHAMESNRGTTAMLALPLHRAGNLACLARDLYVSWLVP
jgi:hypothetical protein